MFQGKLERTDYAAIWNAYNKDYARYETRLLPSFPWNQEAPKDVPRYIKGEDGFWYNPAADDSNMALLSCTGDLMCEPRQHQAYQYGDSYFFHPAFQFIRGIFKNSDFVVGNLETTLSDATPYAGEYHRIAGKYHCNAPACYLDAIRYAGFDALVNANNHNCDSTVTGILDTLGALDQRDFMHTGLFLPDDTERVLFVRINGIRIAVLSYATYFNKHDSLFTDEGKETFLNAYSKERAEADAMYARKRGAQFILVYIHWGKEYTHEPNDEQRRWAKELADAGADYIVGSHSHCLQPHSTVTAADGRAVPVLYSMGNFVTNEKKEISRHTGILQLLLRGEGGRVRVEAEYFIPCYVYPAFGTGRFAPVPADSLLNGRGDDDTLRKAKGYIDALMGLPALPTAAVSLGQICAVLGVAPPMGMEDNTYTHICTRLYERMEGALYFALSSEDDATLGEICRGGATAVISNRAVAGLPCIVVEDVSNAYQKVCGHVKKRFGARTVVVAGYEGKTAAKELISAVLRVENAVLTSRDGAESENSSLQKYHPLAENDITAWQRLHPNHAFYVQEVRQSDAVPPATSMRALSPEFCVLLGGNGACELAQEAIQSMSAGGVLLINGDDRALASAAEELAANGRVRVAAFSAHAQGAQYCAEGIHAEGERLAFILSFGAEKIGLCCTPPFIDEIYPALAAFAVGMEAGMEAKRVARAIENHQRLGYCRNLVKYGGLSLLLNCACKSNPSALAAIDALAQLPVAPAGRRIAVLGDIDAHGEEAAYTNIGAAAAEKDISYLCCCGQNRENIRRAAREAGFPEERLRCCAEEQEYEDLLCGLIRPGDALLFNGGRTMHFNFTLRRLFGFMDGCVD